MAKIRSVTTVAREVPDDQVESALGNGKPSEEEIEEKSNGGEISIPLLPDLSPEDAQQVIALEVIRLVPYRGTITEVDVNTTKSEIIKNFGGKRIQIRAVKTGHKYIKNGSKVYDIDADPIYPNKEDDKPKRENGTDIGPVLEGMLDLRNEINSSRSDNSSTASIIQIALARSETEREMAKNQLEQMRLQIEAKQKQDEMNYTREKERMEREILAREKEAQLRFDAEVKRIELEKAKMDEEKKEREREAKEERERWEKLRQEEKDRISQERKDERDRWEREDKRRELEMKQAESSRKEEIVRLESERKAEAERQRQFMKDSNEQQMKFQAFMAQLSKGGDSIDKMMQVLQLGMELNGGKEEGSSDPMTNLVSKLPMVLDAVMGGRSAPLPARTPTQLPSNAVARRQPTAPAVQPTQTVVQPKEGKRMKRTSAANRAAATAAAPNPAPQAKAVPPWVGMLAFSLAHFTPDLVAEAVGQLYDDETISEKYMNLILQVPDEQAKAWLSTTNPLFVQPAMLKKILEVRELLRDQFSGEEEDEEAVEQVDATMGGLGLPMEEETAEAPAEEAGEEVEKS